MPQLGINLPGFEANDADADRRIGWKHILPQDPLLDWVAARFTHVRLPLSFGWMMPRAGDPFTPALDPANADALDDFLERAAARKLAVLLDVHQSGWTPFGRIEAAPIGFYGALWALADRYKGKIWGIGPMNEPGEIAPEQLQAIMQKAVGVINDVDARINVVVPQPGWSSSWNGLPMPAVKSANLKPWEEVHCYGDGDFSGTYRTPFDQDVCVRTGRAIDVDTLVDRLRPAFADAKAQGRRPPLVGEIGVPGDDPRYVEMLRRALVFIRQQKGLAFVWQSGEFAADRLAIRPATSWEVSRGDALLAMIEAI